MCRQVRRGSRPTRRYLTSAATGSRSGANKRAQQPRWTSRIACPRVLSGGSVGRARQCADPSSKREKWPCLPLSRPEAQSERRRVGQRRGRTGCSLCVKPLKFRNGLEVYHSTVPGFRHTKSGRLKPPSSRSVRVSSPNPTSRSSASNGGLISSERNVSRRSLFFFAARA